MRGAVKLALGWVVLVGLTLAGATIQTVMAERAAHAVPAVPDPNTVPVYVRCAWTAESYDCSPKDI